MKKVLCIVLVLFFHINAFALDGKVSHDELISDTSVKTKILKGEVFYDDGKTVTPFFYKGKLNGYGVQYDNDLLHNYYYDLSGNLTQYDVLDRPRNIFPNKTVSYDANGKIISYSESYSKSEQVVFNPKGVLIARWIGNVCYDSDGKMLSSRRELQ